MATHISSAPRDARDALNVALWIAQLALCVVFAVTGFMKVTMPIARLARTMSWVSGVPPALVHVIGLAELAGALGVLLPALTRVHPELTPLAAVCLTIVMALATVVNLAGGEATRAPVTLVLGALAAFVAWGRYARAPITPRRAPRSASADRLGRVV
jgi:uncharacterized membrane protein YphA (DoxX/SURF4 family)